MIFFISLLAVFLKNGSECKIPVTRIACPTGVQKLRILGVLMKVVSMSKKIGWFGMLHPCDEECPSGISRLAARTSPQIPAGGAQGGKAGGTFKQSWKNQGKQRGETGKHRGGKQGEPLNRVGKSREAQGKSRGTDLHRLGKS